MEIDKIIEILSKLNIATLLAMGGMLWVLKKHLDKKFDKIEMQFKNVDNEFKSIREEMQSEFKSVRGDMQSEFKSLREEIKEIRTSLNRMEGAFYSKECCMLSNNIEKKAQ